MDLPFFKCQRTGLDSSHQTLLQNASTYPHVAPLCSTKHVSPFLGCPKDTLTVLPRPPRGGLGPSQAAPRVSHRSLRAWGHTGPPHPAPAWSRTAETPLPSMVSQFPPLVSPAPLAGLWVFSLMTTQLLLHCLRYRGTHLAGKPSFRELKSKKKTTHVSQAVLTVSPSSRLSTSVA